MGAPFSQEFKQGFWIAVYEYLIISLPVGIYVILECLHQNDWTRFVTSPEWSIVTIFLAFISLSRYVSTIKKAGTTVFEPIIGIMSVVILLVIICAILNAKASIDKESYQAIYFRIFLFSITTVFFFIFMTGTQLIRNRDKHV